MYLNYRQLNYPPLEKKRLTGFTFVEAMVTLAVLSSALLFINEAYLRFVTASNYFFRRNYAHNFLYNKIWELENQFRQNEDINTLEKSGSFTLESREFQWSATLIPLDDHNELYEVLLEINWPEGANRNLSLSLSSFIHK